MVAIAASVGAVLGAQAITLSGRVRTVLGRAARSVSTGIWAVLRAVVLLPVFLVVTVPARLLGDLARMAGRPEESGWQVRDERSNQYPTRAGGRGRSTARPVAERWVGRRAAFRAVVALLAVQALVGGIVVVRQREPESSFGGVSEPGAMESAALSGLPWLAEAGREAGEVSAGLTFAPYTGFALRDYSGRYINVRDRVRRSYQPAVGAGQVINVWFLGGSTTFGFDLQRDEHTIPSEVARLAEQDGLNLRVRNYGAPGYVNYTETVLLAMLLGEGERPDLVVFYDGINDVSAQTFNVVAGSGPAGEPTYLAAEYTRRVLAGSPVLPEGSPEALGPLVPRRVETRPLSASAIVTSTVDVYRQGVDLAEMLGGRYGFDVLHYWQPVIYSRGRLDPGERERLDELRIDQYDYRTLRALDQAVRDALPAAAFDLGAVLDDVEGPVFSDQVHTNEVGARAVADEMYRTMAPQLERLLSATQSQR